MPGPVKRLSESKHLELFLRSSRLSKVSRCYTQCVPGLTTSYAHDECHHDLMRMLMALPLLPAAHMKWRSESFNSGTWTTLQPSLTCCRTWRQRGSLTHGGRRPRCPSTSSRSRWTTTWRVDTGASTTSHVEPTCRCTCWCVCCTARRSVWYCSCTCCQKDTCCNGKCYAAVNEKLTSLWAAFADNRKTTSAFLHTSAHHWETRVLVLSVH